MFTDLDNQAFLSLIFFLFLFREVDYYCIKTIQTGRCAII